jgi:hypothetical protein
MVMPAAEAGLQRGTLVMQHKIGEQEEMSVSEVRGQVTGDGRQVNDVDLRCQGIGVRGCLCRGRVSKRRLGRV